MEKTLVKICGLRRPPDAEAANRVRPDLAGMILSPGFRRSIDLETACSLRRLLEPGIRTVGVFVNAPLEDVLRAVKSGCIDMIQLHGQEDDDYIRKVSGETDLPVIKAFRIGEKKDLDAAAASAASWILLDSGTGTGKPFDWQLLDEFLQGESRAFPGGHPWLLAGGLSMDNVADAVRRFRPTGVDVSSHVETDGWKDPRKMEAFTLAVRSA